ncbi:MAG: Gfo/Idh/MocA family oxidoreductase [Candidatus Aminicenantes bacterium]|nr:Gfo/Idh/MocA family oxidoreductase [Candidatus Aminicenantes bacterium]
MVGQKETTDSIHPDCKKPSAVILIGIGGMGDSTARALLNDFPPEECFLRAAVDPFPDRALVYPSLRQRGIPVFETLSRCLKEVDGDLAVIASPIQHHVRQCLESLQAGMSVLCEKPLTGAVQEGRTLIGALRRTSLWIEIGYQWSFSLPIQDLKRDIGHGIWGEPVRMKSLCLWPRNESYYQRNDWAGKRQDEEGRWILDSPANNAMAHFLHNMLYLLGDNREESAVPVSVEANACRAFPIENFDSVACRVRTDKGVELLFFASHAVPDITGPVFELECAEGTIVYDGPGSSITGRGKDGATIEYGDPETDHFRKLRLAVERGLRGGENVCPPAAALAQTLCVNGIQDSQTSVREAPSDLIRRSEQGAVWIEGLDSCFLQGYRMGKLPSEAGCSWLEKGGPVDLRGYRRFPGGGRGTGGD